MTTEIENLERIRETIGKYNNYYELTINPCSNSCNMSSIKINGIIKYFSLCRDIEEVINFIKNSFIFKNIKIENLNTLSINNSLFVKIKESTLEKIGYEIREREEYIDNLISWINEAKFDKELMKSNLKELLNLKNEFILLSINSNSFISQQEDGDFFQEILNDILLTQKVHLCIYCDRHIPDDGAHFQSDCCGRGMCNTCYDSLVGTNKQIQIMYSDLEAPEIEKLKRNNLENADYVCFSCFSEME